MKVTCATSLAAIVVAATTLIQTAQAQATNLKCTDSGVTEACFDCELNPYPSNRERNKRYEIRDMPSEQWASYVDAMWTMKTLTMEEGRARYGPLFKTHDYMVAIHAVCATSVRGDQGHFGAHFLSWHSAFSLMYETTLMRIAEVEGNVLEGLPYFFNFDNTDVSRVLSDEFYGTHPGTGDNFEIADGSFAYWPIEQNFDISIYDEFITDASDNQYTTGNGFMSQRAPFNPLNSPYLTGYPWQKPGTNESEPYAGASYDDAMACISSGLPYGSNANGVYSFNLCVETPGGPQNWHSSTHQRIGGAAFPEMDGFDEDEMTNPMNPMQFDRGDLNDPITSPNHPIFPTFHSNMDMFMREWQSQSPEGREETWGFPYVGAENYRFRTTYDGINANDPISSTWPFKWSDLGWADPNTAEGNQVVTHAQTTCFLAKENAPYVYVKYSGAPDDAPGVPASEINLLTECEADCDLDSDCAPGLLCADEHKQELKRAGLNKRRAYCDVNIFKFSEVCYDPAKVPVNPNRDCKGNDKCGECEPRDCDNDNQCETGLLCADQHKQELSEAQLDPRKAYCGSNLPGVQSNWELCYDPNSI